MAMKLPSASTGWMCGLLVAIGSTAIVRADIGSRRLQFQAEARTAHRVLSQETARLDAVLATLVLLSSPQSGASEATEKLPALYPQVLAAQRLAPTSPSGAARGREPATAMIDAQHGSLGQYTLSQAGSQAAFLLRIDARRLAATSEWPWPADEPVCATLSLGDHAVLLQDGAGSLPRPLGLTDGFEFAMPLASDSQPFVLHAQRFTGPAQWPWQWLFIWLLLCLFGWWLALRWRQLRAEQLRAGELLRLAQVSRLNMLGELAAGMAHELNQPLAASLAGTQTALRLLRETEDASDDLHTAVKALELAGAQARRAAEVVARLRALVRRQGSQPTMVPTDLREVAQRIVQVLAPQMEERGIAVLVKGQALVALADPVAVEQILHNLLTNAMYVMEDAQQTECARAVVVTLVASQDRARCCVRDSGPGISPGLSARIFEPFFTTRASGLGLGLPLCQTLAMAMDGQLVLLETSKAGTEFVLELPLAHRAGGVT